MKKSIRVDEYIRAGIPPQVFQASSILISVHTLSTTHIKAIHEPPTFTMAPTEMRQTGPPLSLTRPTTPPSSPNPSLSKCFVTSSDAEELVKAVTGMEMTSTYAPKCNCSHTPPKDLLDATFPPATKCCCSRTPPNSPDLPTPAKPITIQDLEHLFLKLFDKRAEDDARVSNNPKLDTPDDAGSKEVVRTSLLAFKEVDEM
jgi:hypothetical protein